MHSKYKFTRIFTYVDLSIYVCIYFFSIFDRKWITGNYRVTTENYQSFTYDTLVRCPYWMYGKRLVSNSLKHSLHRYKNWTFTIIWDTWCKISPEQIKSLAIHSLTQSVTKTVTEQLKFHRKVSECNKFLMV